MIKMIKNLTILFLFTFVGIVGVKAQETDTIRNPEVYYSSVKTYTIANIKITGIGEHYDKETLIQLSGLHIGNEIKIPGEEITKALKRLYEQGMFSDITISIEKVYKDKVYLIINLKSRSKLTSIHFTGLKKSEKSKIKEKINLSPGVQVTENMISNLERIVKKFLKEKGYYNLKVTVLKKDDPKLDNFVNLYVKVYKKNKIKIKHIYINGNKLISDRVIKGAMKKTKDKSILNFFKSAKYIRSEFENDKYNIVDKYNEKGFRDAVVLSDSVVPISNKKVNLYVNVKEGKKYYYNNITWVGNTVYNSDILSNFLNINKGDTYNSKQFDKKLNGNEDGLGDYFYYNKGYIFYRALPIEQVVGKDSINVEIRIMEGPQASINRINISGNTTTHEHVVRRELYTYPGDLFSKENIMRSIRQIANLGNFNPETINPDIKPNVDEGTVDIDYQVEEKSNDQIELSGGWGAGMIIGSLGLSFSNFSIRNIFNWESYKPLPQGDGQKFSLKAQTNGKFYSTFSVSFTEPWLGGRKPNALSVSAYFSKQTGYSSSYKSSYYVGNNSNSNTSGQSMITFGFSAGLGRRIKWPDDYFTMYNGISYQRYTLKNWPYYLISNGNSNNLSFTTSISRSSIDNPIFTRSGTQFTLSLNFTPPYSLFSNKNYASANIEDKDKYRWIEFHKWKFTGKIYMPLDKNEKLILYTGFQYGYLGYYDKYKRSPFEGFEMGGDGMSGYSLYGREYVGLRGYENGSLTNAGSNFISSNSRDASVYSKLTMELRYPLSLQQSATIYLLTFFEAGNSWAKIQDFEPFNLYRSAGVGIRILLPMFGLLGIDWGYGFDDVTGRGDASGSQFHFVLGKEL